MRIPLDYYRILGLPIQATADQLKQAHRDRTLQLPRREYSEAAIATRKHLIDEAFAVLSDPEQRQDYDDQFLATAYETDELTDEQALTIEIDDRQLIGALLILQELGEYELVLKLGRPYLSSGTANLQDGRFGDPKLVLSDIVLTVALSCLELGREQWQQGQYENAAEALETGQELLLREGLFASVRGEIQSDLFKLRPYRILELLALPDANAEERQRGLLLLREMLRERNGIDGTGNDQSGLNIDDFLRFIQQLRGYLTAEEQQLLFEEEARRPSAVATYLAVYALLGRGFAAQQPALIRRAKSMLIKLSHRQDVHLEQSICALLLGQTEEASRVLELSQEFEPLAFIRENSQGAPDLLPGLCLYAERWMQDEVFPHFRDLAKQKASLKDYFANEQVQAYLEELPAEGEAQPAWAMPSLSKGRTYGQDYNTMVASRNGRTVEAAGSGAHRGATATLATSNANVIAMPAAERLANLSPEGSLQETKSGRSRQRGTAGEGRSPGTARNSSHPGSGEAPVKRGDKGKRKSKVLPFLLGFAAVGLLGFAFVKSFRAFVGGDSSASQEPLLVQLDQPVLPIADAPQPVALSGEMTQPLAEQVLKTWFDAKKEAMGSEYSTEKLSQILVDPKLTEWKQNSDAAKRDGLSIAYDHSVKVNAVEISASDPNQATIDATVTEIRRYTQSSQPAETQEDRDLQVRYTVVRRDNEWRITDWQ